MTVWKASIAADREESVAACARRLLDALESGISLKGLDARCELDELIRSLLAEHDEAVAVIRPLLDAVLAMTERTTHGQWAEECSICAAIDRARVFLGEQEGTNP